MTEKANIRQSTLNVEPWKRGRRKSYERRQENGGREWDIRQERKRIMMRETQREGYGEPQKSPEHIENHYRGEAVAVAGAYP